MEIKSSLYDEKVAARSLLLEISINDYLGLAKKIYKNNEFQRKRVRSSKSVYSLLKSDIRNGCVIPPVVLAYRRSAGKLESDVKKAIFEDCDAFVLLDGLQRSITLMELEAELSGEELSDFLSRNIRCEIFEGINKIGILYRMLTLNAGQTPMSVRHQIEIMYHDYLDAPVEGVVLLREVDASRARQSNYYNFKEIMDGFNAYLERSEYPLDRGDILDNISSLENLAKENQMRDVFSDFVKSWNRFVGKVEAFDIVFPRYDDEGREEVATSRVWGSTGVQLFKRGQALSGFGAAIGMLHDDDGRISFENISFDGLVLGTEDKEQFIVDFNGLIENINAKAKKIGNAQRLFFRQFFKMLLWEDSGCYMDLNKASKEAYKSAVRIGI